MSLLGLVDCTDLNPVSARTYGVFTKRTQGHLHAACRLPEVRISEVSNSLACLLLPHALSTCAAMEEALGQLNNDSG